MRSKHDLYMIGGERVKSALLERLSKEKPENTKDEVEEALRRGYSLEQIIKAMAPEVISEPR